MTKNEIIHIIINRIVDNINPKSIILFGSQAKGLENANSDMIYWWSGTKRRFTQC